MGEICKWIKVSSEESGEVVRYSTPDSSMEMPDHPLLPSIARWLNEFDGDGQCAIQRISDAFDRLEWDPSANLSYQEVFAFESLVNILRPSGNGGKCRPNW